MVTQVIEEIRSADRIMLLAHHNADLDSLGSALALAEALEAEGKDVTVGAAESVSKQARYMTESREVVTDPELEGYDLVVTLDAASEEQLEPVELDFSRTVVIDHHQEGDLAERAKAAYVDSSSKSTAQIVHSILTEMDADIGPETAEFLIAGIVGDTSYLRFADPDTFTTIAELLSKTDRGYKDILNDMRVETDISEKIAVLKSIARVKTYRLGDKLACFSTVGSFEASTARTFIKSGADFAIVAVPRKNAVRISGRMDWKHRDDIHLAKDVFEPCADLIEGSAGGHDAAASANGKRPDRIGDTFDRMLELLEEKTGEKAERL